ncbi:hypothetical protein HHX47_DHR1001710, partial [Lentinula edodes]
AILLLNSGSASLCHHSISAFQCLSNATNSRIFPMVSFFCSTTSYPSNAGFSSSVTAHAVGNWLKSKTLTNSILLVCKRSISTVICLLRLVSFSKNSYLRSAAARIASTFARSSAVRASLCSIHMYRRSSEYHH